VDGCERARLADGPDFQVDEFGAAVVAAPQVVEDGGEQVLDLLVVLERPVALLGDHERGRGEV